MNYLKNHAWTFVLAFLIFLTACQKHYATPGNNNSTSASTKKLIRVGDSTNNTQFQYDDAANATALNIVTDSNSNPYTISYVNGAAATVRSQYYATSLNYTNGHVIRTQTASNATSEVQSISLLNYDSDNNLIEKLYYEKALLSTDLQPQLKFEFKNSPAGDIDKADIYLWDTNSNQYIFEGSNKYEYDAHANPTYALKDLYSLFFTFPATPHNITKETVYDYTGTLIAVVTYEYTYDSEGNPLKAKRTYSPTGMPQQISTVTYTYTNNLPN